jgi:hypothetical protein
LGESYNGNSVRLQINFCKHCHKQILGFRDNCYKRYEIKDEAIMAFGVYMKGGRYEQMVEHGVCKQEAEV